MKQTKRLSALLLVVVLAVTSIPTHVFAAENSTNEDARTSYTAYQQVAEISDEYTRQASADMPVKTARNTSGTTSASNYDTLYSYIERNGRLSSSGTRFLPITTSVSGTEYKIELSLKSNGIQFYISDYDGSTFVVFTSFILQKNSKTMIATSSIYYGFDSVSNTINIDRSNYTGKGTYRLSQGGSVITASQATDLFNAHLRLSVALFDRYLFNNLGFGMSGLGFVSYNGYGSIACDIPSGYHNGSLQLRNQRPAGCLVDGYTGDYYCTSCGEKARTGNVISCVGHHNYSTVNASQAYAPLKLDGYTGDMACLACGDVSAQGQIISTGGENIGSGTCGDHLTWVLKEDGTLMIFGTGAMDSNMTWGGNKAAIKTVVIGKGVTGIGSSAFSGCANLRSIVLSADIASVGTKAFYNCSSLTAVFYRGTQAEKNGISVAGNNSRLTNATWHYEVTTRALGNQLAYHCTDCDLFYRPDGSGAEFADVSKTSWQIKFANYACVRGLMAGKGTDGQGRPKFDPNSPITREEFVQVLYNTEGKPIVDLFNPFPDVMDTGWYKNAVLWAKKNNIANGGGDGRFGIGAKITRQDLALMLYKYAALKGCSLDAAEGTINQFADGSKVASYARTAMDWAVTNGILSGKGTAGQPLSTFMLDPAGTATRAECAAMLTNFMDAFNMHSEEIT